MTSKTHQTVTDTIQSPCGKYGILLGSSRKYVNLIEGAQNIIKSNRSFTIYTWAPMPDTHPNRSIFRTNSGSDSHGYLPWIHYTGKNFRLMNSQTWYNLQKKEPSIMPGMHLWLKNDNELKNWLGEENYLKMVADLI